MTLPIQTERLVLRRFEIADIGAMLDFLAHPSVARATPNIEATEAGVRSYIESQITYRPFEQDKLFDLAIELKAEGRVIGMLTLITRQHQMGEIGWAMHIDYRGRGLATEAAAGLVGYAFTNLGLHRIQASTTSDNGESLRLMARLGMRQEARLKEAELWDGQWLDVLIYGLLVDEWRDRG